MLYIQAVGYMWCTGVAAFLFVLFMQIIIADIGKEPFPRLLLVTLALCLPLLFSAFHFGAIAAMLVFW